MNFAPENQGFYITVQFYGIRCQIQLKMEVKEQLCTECFMTNLFCGYIFHLYDHYIFAAVTGRNAIKFFANYVKI